jgi:hypothetical protein
MARYTARHIAIITGKSIVTLLLVGLLAIVATSISPIYNFSDPQPFSGSDVFDPYRHTDSCQVWIRANLHTHTLIPTPLNECDYSAEETIEAGLADRITDPLITGALVPEEVETEEVTPSNVAMPEVVNSAASEIIRYLLGRLAYRIEEWLERLHEKNQEKRELKREIRREERDAKREERQAEREAKRGDKANKESEPIPAEESALPQAAAQSPSRIRFEERQRQFSATQIKATDDPSMNQPQLGSNEQAYADDAKAFGRY